MYSATMAFVFGCCFMFVSVLLVSCKNRKIQRRKHNEKYKEILTWFSQCDIHLQTKKNFCYSLGKKIVQHMMKIKINV